jgi:hypothetical protein
MLDIEMSRSRPGCTSSASPFWTFYCKWLNALRNALPDDDAPRLADRYCPTHRDLATFYGRSQKKSNVKRVPSRDFGREESSSSPQLKCLPPTQITLV